MTTLLHIDSSARSGTSDIISHGSHTRRLTARFIRQWLTVAPKTKVIYRDVGQNPPPAVTEQWIHAAFTPEHAREAWMQAALQLSDALVDEVLAADLIIAGVPMYNFGPPAQFKAYIDNIVRVGRTFGFDRHRQGEPYWPLLQNLGKRLVLLSARGDYGYEPGGRIEKHNHVEASICSAFAYIGVSDVYQAAIEYDEFADQRLQDSIADAERAVDELVAMLVLGQTLAVQ